MNEVVISKQKPPHESMDYDALRKMGIEHLQKLSGKIWTDYNVHDPGVTILEMLCYAITDLGYRTNLDIKDILANKNNDDSTFRKDLFTAAEILPCNPLTINDFRKILIDNKDIRNAWLEISNFQEQALFCDNDYKILDYTGSIPVNLKGLYDVCIELNEQEKLGDLNSEIVEWELNTNIPENKKVNIEVIFPSYNKLNKCWRKKITINEVTIVSLIKKTIPTDDTIITSYKKQPNYYEAELKISAENNTITESLKIKITFLPSLDLKNTTIVTSIEKAINESFILTGDTEENKSIITFFNDKIIEITRILSEARVLLNTYRNICEDFNKIDLIKIQEIAVNMNVEIVPEMNPEEVLANIYFALDDFISPEIKATNLEELINKGKTPDQIFEGPLLKNGFIEDEQFETNTKKYIFTSDLINIIMDIEGVIAVKNLRISDYKDGLAVNENKKNFIKLENSDIYKPKLSTEESIINISKKEKIIPVDAIKSKEIFKTLKSANQTQTLYSTEDIGLPQGINYDIESYFSIEENFPLTYGIGKDGLSETVSDLRKSQAKQLKAYLVFFEQLLANYLSQLAHVKDLFSLREDIDKTYFHQSLYDIPNIAPLFKDFIDENPEKENDEAFVTAWQEFTSNDSNKYIEFLKTIFENTDNKVYLERRNRFLEHLMARFCESFSEYSLLLFSKNKSTAADKLIQDKISFLSEYPAISSDRAKGFNYMALDENKNPDAWDTKNVEGLKKRLCKLLGIKDYTRRNLTSDINSFFEVYEEKDDDGISELRFRLTDTDKNILLSSTKHFKNLTELEKCRDEVVLHGKNKSNYKINKTKTGKYYFLLVDDYDGKTIAKRVEQFDTKEDAAAQINIVVNFLGSDVINIEGFHLVDNYLLRPKYNTIINGNPVKNSLLTPYKDDLNNHIDEGIDPYSFRISLIFPSTVNKFNDEDFKNFILKQVFMETPAHIIPHIHFVDSIKLTNFENAYKDWLMNLAAPIPDDDSMKNDYIVNYNNSLNKFISVMNDIKG
jgi:hypothetical protein